MFIGNINTIPSIVNLPGQRNVSSDLGAAYAFQVARGNWFEAVFNSALGKIDNIAISCWIKIDASFFVPPTNPTSDKESHIVDKFSSTTVGGYRLFLRHRGADVTPGGGQIQLVFQATGPGTSPVKTLILTLPTSGQNEIKANTVYLVTADHVGDNVPVAANGSIRLRGANGVSLNKTTTDFSITEIGDGFPPFVIGNANPTTATKGFAGAIDEVALWSDSTQINSASADRLFNWPVYKDLMNSDPLGEGSKPENWFRMGENTTENGGVLTMPNVGRVNTNLTLTTDSNITPLPTKVSGLPNELYA